MVKIIIIFSLLSIANSQNLKEDNFIIKFVPSEVVYLEKDSKRGYKYSNSEFDEVCKINDIFGIESTVALTT